MPRTNLDMAYRMHRIAVRRRRRRRARPRRADRRGGAAGWFDSRPSRSKCRVMLGPAGIQTWPLVPWLWIPAFAGMTEVDAGMTAAERLI